METLHLGELVQITIAKSAKKPVLQIIDNNTTLSDLGYDEVDILELKVDLFKAIRVKQGVEVFRFQDLRLTPDSTVQDVIDTLSRVLPSKITLGQKYHAKKMKLNRTLAATVCTLLSERTPAYNFTEIKPEFKLDKDLKLDETSIAQLKLDLFTIFGLSGNQLNKFNTALNIAKDASVQLMIDQVAQVIRSNKNFLAASSLPGDDDTEI
jgi:hypothetical protein